MVIRIPSRLIIIIPSRIIEGRLIIETDTTPPLPVKALSYTGIILGVMLFMVSLVLWQR